MNSNLDELAKDVIDGIELTRCVHDGMSQSERIGLIQGQLTELSGADFEKQYHVFLGIAEIALASAQSVARRNDAAEGEGE